MVIVITSILLRSPLQFFKLSRLGGGIMLQAKRNTACRKFKNTGFWKLHYTMTAWDNHAEMQAFARSGEHLAAMKHSKELSSEIRTYTYESSEIPGWKDAKALLLEKGKSIRF